MATDILLAAEKNLLKRLECWIDSFWAGGIPNYFNREGAIGNYSKELLISAVIDLESTYREVWDEGGVGKEGGGEDERFEVGRMKVTKVFSQKMLMLGTCQTLRNTGSHQDALGFVGR